jgi:dihydropteroate synthase
MPKSKLLQSHSTMNCRGKLISLEKPIVMGILNATPDSFFNKGRESSMNEVLKNAEKMLQDGASILDIGGMSSRPNAELVSLDEELKRVIPVIESIIQNFPEALISIDSFRSQVARLALEAGASIINDISAAEIDSKILNIASDFQVPYICMHMQGTPQTMQQNPSYDNVTLEVLDFFIFKINQCKKIGITDIILDVGFGFGKNMEHNYELLRNMNQFSILEKPLLAGISRKSMVSKALNTTSEHSLNGTTALHMLALSQGAKILRVHDVKEAKECITLHSYYEGN